MNGLDASFFFTASAILQRWAPPEIVAFLTDLAVERNVAAAIQNLAHTALLFLYREILDIELPWLEGVQHAKRPVHLPVVLSGTEVVGVLKRLRGTHRLIGSLLYGAGLRTISPISLSSAQCGKRSATPASLNRGGRAVVSPLDKR